jgi:hypothetical protein
LHLFQNLEIHLIFLDIFFLFFSYADEPIFSQNMVMILQIVLGSYPAGSQEEVKSDPEEPPKENPSPSSAESQEKVESNPK